MKGNGTGMHTSAACTVAPVAPHVGDADGLGRDGGKGACYAHKLAATFACSAVELDDGFLVFHFDSMRVRFSGRCKSAGRQLDCPGFIPLLFGLS